MGHLPRPLVSSKKSGALLPCGRALLSSQPCNLAPLPPFHGPPPRAPLLIFIPSDAGRCERSTPATQSSANGSQSQFRTPSGHRVPQCPRRGTGHNGGPPYLVVDRPLLHSGCEIGIIGLQSFGIPIREGLWEGPPRPPTDAAGHPPRYVRDPTPPPIPHPPLGLAAYNPHKQTRVPEKCSSESNKKGCMDFETN